MPADSPPAMFVSELSVLSDLIFFKAKLINFSRSAVYEIIFLQSQYKMLFLPEVSWNFFLKRYPKKTVNTKFLKR